MELTMKVLRSALPLLLAWVLAVAASAHFNSTRLDDRAEVRALAKARTTLNLHVAYRDWAALQGGVYVEPSTHTPPNPQLAEMVKDRDVITTGGRRLTLVNPAYMTRQVMDDTSVPGGLQSRIVSLKPVRSGNAADDWDARALSKIAESGTSSYFERVSGASNSERDGELRYLEALYITPSCLKCHEQLGYKVGDLRGGLSIRVPLASFYDDSLSERHTILVTHAATGLVGVLLILLMVGRLSRAAARIQSNNVELAAARDRAVADQAEIARAHIDLVSSHQKLLHADKLASVGKLAAGVAHEINTPLGYVGTNVDVLREYTEDLLTTLEKVDAASRKCAVIGPCRDVRQAIEAGEYREIRTDLRALVSQTQQGIDRIRDIVANLKGFARPGNQGERTQVSLNDCCRQSLAVAAHEINRYATVVRDYADLPEIWCRPSEINQILLNLLINAAHAMPERGTLTVRTGATDDCCWVEVEDNGVGIALDVQRQVFEPFFTTKPVGTGTGLGLSISYGIAQAHGGTLSFVSTPGQGTTFRLVLPRRQAVVSDA